MFFYVAKILWFVATPSNLCAVLIAAGLALAKLGRPRPGLRLGGLGCALLIVIGLGPIGDWAIMPLEDRFPTYVEGAGRVDGIVVLGGAVYTDVSAARDQLSTGQAGERLLALADLARRYPSARLVYSGGSGNLLVPDARVEAELVAAAAETLGIASGRVMVEGTSRDTWENAVNTRALVIPAPGERWLLVTSAWHMPRAIGCFRQVGFPVTAYPVDFRTRGPAD
ncbi:MAG TPA: YdcF family protein, partial [Enterovirga sp.]